VSAIDAAGRPTRAAVGAAGAVHREARGGQPEHHHREEARHEDAAAGSPAKKRFEVAGRRR
jgi:hypothetical protein